jgi:hypothetical protein
MLQDTWLNLHIILESVIVQNFSGIVDSKQLQLTPVSDIIACTSTALLSGERSVLLLDLCGIAYLLPLISESLCNLPISE